jgi:hypothetical protein
MFSNGPVTALLLLLLAVLLSGSRGSGIGFPLGDGGDVQLWEAVKMNNQHLVLELVQAGAEVDARNPDMVRCSPTAHLADAYFRK